MKKLILIVAGIGLLGVIGFLILNTKLVFKKEQVASESIVYFASDRSAEIDKIIKAHIYDLSGESSLVTEKSRESYVHNTGAKGFRVFAERSSSIPCEQGGAGKDEETSCPTKSPLIILFLEGGYGKPNLSIDEFSRLPTIDDSWTSMSGFVDSMSQHVPVVSTDLQIKAEDYAGLSLGVICSEGVEVYETGSYENNLCSKLLVYFSSDEVGFNSIESRHRFYVLNEGLKDKEGSATFTLIATQRGGREIKSEPLIVTVDSYLPNEQLAGTMIVNNRTLRLNDPHDLPDVLVTSFKDRFGAFSVLKTAIDPLYAMQLIDSERFSVPGSSCQSIASCFKQGLERLEFAKNNSSIVYLDDATEKGESSGTLKGGDLYVRQPLHLVGVSGIPAGGIVRFVFHVREVYDSTQKKAKYVISGYEVIPYGDKWKLFQ